MLAQKPTRQSLRSKARLPIRTDALPEGMDIEHPLPLKPPKRPLSQKRSFGQDITNQELNGQVTVYTTVLSQNLPQMCLVSQVTHHCQMIEEIYPQRRKSEIEIYSEDIESHLLLRESLYLPSPEFMETQDEVTPEMREILVSWLAQLRSQFKLKAETLFKTVSLIDLYLWTQPITKAKLQLLGITCLFISCKYEEIYIQHINRFVSVCAATYTIQDLLEMESCVMIALNFNLSMVSSLRIMELKCEVLQLDEQVIQMSQYLLELSLFKCSLSAFKSSILAIAAIYLSGKILQNRGVAESELRKDMQHKEEFKACLKEMFQVYKCRDSGRNEAVTRRFLSKFQC